MSTEVRVYECPFCDSNVMTFTERTILTNSKFDGHWYMVTCEKCGANGPLGKDYDDAAEKWNAYISRNQNKNIEN